MRWLWFMSSLVKTFTGLIHPAFIADYIYQLHTSLHFYGLPWPLPRALCKLSPTSASIDCDKQKASTFDIQRMLFSFHLLPVCNSWPQLISSCQVNRVTGVLFLHFRLLWTDYSPQKRRFGNNLWCYSDETCNVEAPCLQTGWIMISVSKWGVQMECGSLSCLALPPLNWCTDCHFTVVH